VVTSSGEEPASVAIDQAGFLQRAIGEQLNLKAAGTFGELSHIVDAASAGARTISTSFSPGLAREVRAWLQEPALVAAASGSDVGAAAG
jgi:deoxyribose-phosphate aldolase